MLKYVIKRILQLIPILLAASILIFALVRLSPSDPIASMTTGKAVSAETRQSLEEHYHLDKSYPEQYLIWITGALQGNLGESFIHKQTVNSLIAGRLPTTLQLVFMSAILALIIAIPVGVISAVKMNTPLDRTLSVLTLIFVASPVFLTALLLMLFFALKIPLVPVFGTGDGFWDNFKYLFLPSVALSLNMVALISRITRSNMIQELNSNYATTAIAKGVPYRRVVMGHCLKNALIPVITVTSIEFGTMIVGAVLVENVFALGGIGDVLLQGVKAADYPVVQGITLLLVAIFLLINLLVDIIYAAIDPRIRPQ